MTRTGQKSIYKPRVLLLDDDSIILKATEKSLKGLGVDIDKLNSGKPDLNY